MQTTVLHSVHLAAGARMVDFAGWQMSVQYAGIMQEHAAVRGAAGLFDISHMGQVVVSGPGATEWLDGLLTNAVHRLAPGQGHYTLMLNESGGVIDDLLLYREGPDAYFLVINAAKIPEDLAWLAGHLPADSASVSLRDHSGRTFGLALQGPRTGEIHAALFGPDAALPGRNHLATVSFGGESVRVARTGYTGEDGVEYFGPAALGPLFWEKLLAAGAPLGLAPCGLGARDTLRLEMGYPLNGSDLSPTRTPLEAGLGFFCDLAKSPSFIGQAALLAQKSGGLAARLTAFRLAPGAPPLRSHYLLYLPGGTEPVGEVCSGALSPTLRIGIGMAYLPMAQTAVGTALEVDIRGRRFPATVCKKPFVVRK